MAYVEGRVKTWVERYENNIFFASLTVSKNDNSFVAQVVSGYGNESGESELAYLFATKTWR